jgi:hypothetical protein
MESTGPLLVVIGEDVEEAVKGVVITGLAHSWAAHHETPVGPLGTLES